MATYVIKIVSLMAILSCITFTSAKVYTVGDSGGWAINVDYTAWTSDKTFLVGDSLLFNSDSSHTVDEVSSDDYTTCNVGNSIMSYNSGTTTITLNTTGSHYFICGAVGHCSVGMKLTVDVTGSGSGVGAGVAGSPSAAPSSVITGDSPTTTPFGTTLSPPNVAGTSNMPVDSSSPAVSPFAAAVFSLVALMSVSILG